MLKSDEISLVVNQDAGRVSSKMRLLSKLAKKHNLKLKFCDGPDLDNTLREVLKNKKIKRLIIGGGDGTVSHAASLVLRKNSKIEIAVLPLGTANYYARSLGVNRQLTHAFNVAMKGKIENRHMCRANKRDFLIGVNIGTTSNMFEEVTDEDKKRFGKLAYFKGVFTMLLKTSPPDLSVKVNGKKYHFTSTELVVLNQYIDEPIQLVPKVQGSEPYFEIITYGLGKNKLSPLFAVVIFALTLGRNQKYLKRIKTTKAVIKSNQKQSVAIDGESIESLPLKITLIKKSVRFLRHEV
jgi:diacylglycerol kinase family enzyme